MASPTNVTRELTGDYAVERVRQKIEELEREAQQSYEPIGSLAAHEAAADPHPQYGTATSNGYFPGGWG